MVLKPAEFTSLTALLFGELCAEAGLPAGVVNIITGDGRTGEALVAHPGVDKIAFTGSTDVGRLIRVATAGTGKKLSLELGGKSPFVVFDDADLDSVVEGVVDAIWFNQGQVCCAGSRILAQEGIAPRLEARLKARMETLRVGRPARQGGGHRRHHRAGAAREDPGAGGAGRGRGRPDVAAVVELSRPRATSIRRRSSPTWRPSATIAQVEIFGPVVVMMTFRTPVEAVELANNTRYGLAASVWTENINLALDIAPKLKAGTVWINCTNVFDAAAGFGGYRESGFGREGGKEGLWEYVKEGGAAGQAGQGGSEGRMPAETAPRPRRPAAPPAIDRTPKLYIGGRAGAPRFGVQPAGARRRGRAWPARWGTATARTSGTRSRRRTRRTGWARATAHLRAQVLYYVAENLAARRDEFVTPDREPHRPVDEAGLGGGRALARPRSSATPPGPTSGTAGSTTRRTATSRSRCRSRSA